MSKSAYATLEKYIQQTFAYSNASEEAISAARSLYVVGFEHDRVDDVWAVAPSVIQEWFAYTNAEDDEVEAGRSAFAAGYEERWINDNDDEPAVPAATI